VKPVLVLMRARWPRQLFGLGWGGDVTTRLRDGLFGPEAYRSVTFHPSHVPQLQDTRQTHAVCRRAERRDCLAQPRIRDCSRSVM